jgi:hypothetical protein
LAGHPCQSTQARTPPASCSSLEPAVSHSHQHPLFSSKASIQASQTILVILAPWPAWPPWPWPPWPAWPLWLTSCRTWSLISKQVAQHACRTHEHIHCQLHSEVHVHAIIQAEQETNKTPEHIYRRLHSEVLVHAIIRHIRKQAGHINILNVNCSVKFQMHKFRCTLRCINPDALHRCMNPDAFTGAEFQMHSQMHDFRCNLRCIISYAFTDAYIYRCYVSCNLIQIRGDQKVRPPALIWSYYNMRLVKSVDHKPSNDHQTVWGWSNHKPSNCMRLVKPICRSKCSSNISQSWKMRWSNQ